MYIFISNNQVANTQESKMLSMRFLTYLGEKHFENMNCILKSYQEMVAEE